MPNCSGRSPRPSISANYSTRWFARLAQKIVALLGTVTGAGRLFEVDVRLTERGRELIDRLFPEQLERERQLLAPLEAGEREQLGVLLAKLLRSLDGVVR